MSMSEDKNTGSIYISMLILSQHHDLLLRTEEAVCRAQAIPSAFFTSFCKRNPNFVVNQISQLLDKWMHNATDWLYLNAQWGSSGRITVNDIPVFINQEFWKIPLNTVSKYATFARLQELVQWGGIITIHIHLPIHKIKFHKASTPTQMTKNI